MTTAAAPGELDEFRASVRDWCRAHVPVGWRQDQNGASDEDFVRFQRAWFAQLHQAGFAVPHWPAEWGGGMSAAQQVVLYSELAAHDAPRLILAFVGIHHAASTLLAAGTPGQRQRHLPAILDGEIWVQGFSEPEAGSDLASLRTTARKEGDGYVVNGQKLWASGAMHADWCLLLARTDPAAPKRRGISYFLLDMRSPGIEVRPIRQATGESHFGEIFLTDVVIPASQLIGPENGGWPVAQATLGAERGMTMLELAERLGHAGFGRLLETASRPGLAGERPIDDGLVRDTLAGFETDIAGLRSLCRTLVERHDTDGAGPAGASIVKLYYSELLQRMMDFGLQISGLPAHTELTKPVSAGWESGAWALDFIGSWEWTVPGGTSEIQRTIIGERGLGLPREAGGALMSEDLAEIRDELREVARDLLGRAAPAGRPTGTDGGTSVDWRLLAEAGWLGLEVAGELDGADATFAEVSVIAQELGRAAARSPYLGAVVLGVGTLNLLEASPGRDDLLGQLVSGSVVPAAALASGEDLTAIGEPPPFRIERTGRGLRLHGRAEFVPDAAGASPLLLLAADPGGTPVIVAAARGLPGIDSREQPVLDATRSLGLVSADDAPVSESSIWRFATGPQAAVRHLLDRAAVAVACDSLGLSEAMLDATVGYAQVREQFGRPIGSFQAVKHACADMLVQICVARQLVTEAVERLAAPGVGDYPEATVAASMAKSYACGTAVDAAGKAMQLHGGIGYTWESGIHVYLKRAMLNRALFGSPAAHRRRLAARYA